MKKKCFRCMGNIDEDSNYYEFIEIDKSKFINKDYCHRVCWDTFLESIGNTKEAMGMLRGLKTKMQEIGLLPEEVVEVTP